MRPVAWLAPLACVAACTKTPPEPSPVASTAPILSADTQQKAAPVKPVARCVAPTPKEAPPIPPHASAAACPPDPDGPLRPLPTRTVRFLDVDAGPSLEVEMAAAPSEVERGLMYRRSMPEDHGMLFRMSERKVQTFWMHNTCTPLDMLFVDSDGVVVGIVESATPLTDDPRSVGCPSAWVLEVNAGWCRRHGVAPGQRLALPSP